MSHSTCLLSVKQPQEALGVLLKMFLLARRVGRPSHALTHCGVTPQCTRGSDPTSAATACAATRSQGTRTGTSARLTMRTWPNAANRIQRLAPSWERSPSLAPRPQTDRTAVLEGHPKILYLAPKTNIRESMSRCQACSCCHQGAARKVEAPDFLCWGRNEDSAQAEGSYPFLFSAREDFMGIASQPTPRCPGNFPEM